METTSQPTALVLRLPKWWPFLFLGSALVESSHTFLIAALQIREKLRAVKVKVIL